jgi:hypothetical protein
MADEKEEKKEEKKPKTDVEIMAEKRKEEEAKEEKIKKGVQDYFESMGIDPNITRNEFGLKEALETFAKAEDALKRRKDNKNLVRNILDFTFHIFKLIT